MSTDSLSREHCRCRDFAMHQFTSTRKMGGDDFSRSYREQLESEIEIVYDSFVRHNAGKNVLAGLQTPIVLFVSIVIEYIVSGLLAMLGLESLATIFNLLMLLLLAVLAAWAYTRYTGQHPDVGAKIDELATAVLKVSTHAWLFVILKFGSFS